VGRRWDPFSVLILDVCTCAAADATRSLGRLIRRMKSPISGVFTVAG
jgi:hypothetical protein